MPTNLSFRFEISGHRDAVPPNVQIFVDANLDGDMEQSERVDPLKREGNVFSGRFQIPRPSPEGTGFLVKFRTTPGAKWRLRVISDQPSRHIVYEETDRAPKADGRIIGWCRR